MRRVKLLETILLVGIATSAAADETPQPAEPQRLIFAFASLRDRPAFSSLFLYRHDGVGKGEAVGSIPPLNERADSHPALSADGTVCAYASKQTGGFTPLINFWNVREKRLLPGPPFNTEPGARIEPALGGSGRLLAYST